MWPRYLWMSWYTAVISVTYQHHTCVIQVLSQWISRVFQLHSPPLVLEVINTGFHQWFCVKHENPKYRSLVYWGRKMWHQYWCQLELLSKLVWTFQYILLVTPASHLNTDTFLSGFNRQLIDPSMLFHLFSVAKRL